MSSPRTRAPEFVSRNRRGIAILTLVGLVLNLLALPAHLAFEEHTWSGIEAHSTPPSAGSERSTVSASGRHGHAHSHVHSHTHPHTVGHRHSHPHPRSPDESGPGSEGLPHPAHPAGDHEVGSAPLIAYSGSKTVDGPQPLVLAWTEGVDRPTNTPDPWQIDDPPQSLPLRNLLERCAPRAPPCPVL